jgi:hypothetical protein
MAPLFTVVGSSRINSIDIYSGIAAFVKIPWWKNPLCVCVSDEMIFTWCSSLLLSLEG